MLGEGSRPASAAERRIRAIDDLAADGRSHTVSVAVEVAGELDPPRLRRAVDACLARRDILRSRFEMVDGELWARPETDVDASLDVVDGPLAEVPAGPLPADRPPLLRVSLIAPAADRTVVVLTAHRIVGDRSVLAGIAREIAAGYGSSAAAGNGPADTAGAAGYGSAAVSANGPADASANGAGDASPDGAADASAYWRERLGGDAVAALLTDLPRPATQSYRAATHRVPLADDLVAWLRDLGRRRQLPPQTLLLAGLMALLASHSARDEVLVGWQGATDRPDDTLLVRGDLAGVGCWHDVITTVAAAVDGARAHHLPFDDLVTLLAPVADPSRRPLCQLGFESITWPPLAFGGAPASWLTVDEPVAEFDLKWTVFDDGSSLTCAVQYATDLWLPETVARLADTWVRMLRHMAADPSAPLAACDLLSAGDRARIERWNDTARPLPEPATVDGLVAAWMRDTPDRVALTEAGHRWTYAELDRRTRQVARLLTEAGVPVDRPVGIHLERGAELVIAMLGALRAGAAYAVLDPAHPVERLAFMIRDLSMAAVLTGPAVPDWLRGEDAKVIELPAADARAADADAADSDATDADAADSDATDAGAADPTPRSRPDGLAAAMFTSGSTGTPKAVGVTHRGMVRLITRTNYVDIGPDDVLLHLGDPSFDITTFETWGALCNGARVDVLPGGEALGPEEVLAAIDRVRPTILALTGTLFNRVVDLRPAAFAELGHLFVVGEVMDPVRTRRVLRAGPPGRLINGYGPTENTTFSTCQSVGALPGDAVAVPIGPAVANTTLHVLDQLMRPVPIGFPGELYLGGAGLSRGYLCRPEETAERFVPDPFATPPGGRLYRTGDLVRWRPDGALDFLGRIDQQVKVRGYRIETGEIEAALLATGAVRECAVRPVEVNGDKRLVAYVTGADGALRVAELIAELRRRLPGFMLPNHFVVLDELPTTPSGKLDSRALPGVDRSLPVSDADRVAPRTSVEELVWEVWARTLNVREFGVHDNFFLLGGHSLLAIVAATEIAARLDVDVPARLIFETRTVAGLAAELAGRAAARAGGPTDEVDEVDDLVRRIEQQEREGNVR